MRYYNVKGRMNEMHNFLVGIGWTVIALVLGAVVFCVWAFWAAGRLPVDDDE